MLLKNFITHALIVFVLCSSSAQVKHIAFDAQLQNDTLSYIEPLSVGLSIGYSGKRQLSIHSPFDKNGTEVYFRRTDQQEWFSGLYLSARYGRKEIDISKGYYATHSFQVTPYNVDIMAKITEGTGGIKEGVFKPGYDYEVKLIYYPLGKESKRKRKLKKEIIKTIRVDKYYPANEEEAIKWLINQEKSNCFPTLFIKCIYIDYSLDKLTSDFISLFPDSYYVDHAKYWRAISMDALHDFSSFSTDDNILFLENVNRLLKEAKASTENPYLLRLINEKLKSQLLPLENLKNRRRIE
ncbi:MAG: hypothetical protein MI974_31760 [Chitinophagales bacterium]|nr:hypothetical protein [Chitinophagales bacterium]